MTHIQHEQYMRRCIELADKAAAAGDNPFGSIIVDAQGKIIAEARNQIAEHDVTQHAEIMAMKQAQSMCKTDNFSDCAIYSNIEPCPMCSFIMRELKFNTVVFALASPQMGGYSRWNILEDRGLTKFEPVFGLPPQVIVGTCDDEARASFKRAGWGAMLTE